MDKKLLLLLQQKDERGYLQLFKDYYSLLYNYAYRILQDKAIAEDAVQDAFLELYIHSNHLNDDSHIQHYLYTLVYNKCINTVKHGVVISKYKQKVLSDFYFQQILPSPDVDEELQQIRLDYVNRIIKQLPEKCRKIMELKLEGNSNHEIGKILDISIKTVEAQITLAYKKIKTRIDKLILFLFFNHTFFVLDKFKMEKSI